MRGITSITVAHTGETMSRQCLPRSSGNHHLWPIPLPPQSFPVQGEQPGAPKLRASNIPSFIQIQGEEVERLSLRAWDEHILIVRVLRAREPLSPLPASPPCPHPPPTDKRKSYRPATPGDAPIPCPVGFP